MNRLHGLSIDKFLRINVNPLKDGRGRKVYVFLVPLDHFVNVIFRGVFVMFGA